MAEHPHDKVALTVVRFLGLASITGLIVVGVLCYVALQYGAEGSTVAVIAIVGNLASAALASLGSILASTGKSSPQPVTVENTTADPVPTEPQIPATTQTPEPHPDAPATSDL